MRRGQADARAGLSSNFVTSSMSRKEVSAQKDCNSLRAVVPSTPLNHSGSGTLKPCFFRSMISSGNNPRTAFLRRYFVPPVSEFRFSRYAECEFDKLVIEKRHAGFEADAHAHFIDAHQQQLRQAEVQVQIRHPVEIGLVPCVGEEPLPDWRKGVPRSETAKPFPQVGVEQPEFLGVRISSSPPQKTGLPLRHVAAIHNELSVPCRRLPGAPNPRRLITEGTGGIGALQL